MVSTEASQPGRRPTSCVERCHEGFHQASVRHSQILITAVLSFLISSSGSIRTLRNVHTPGTSFLTRGLLASWLKRFTWRAGSVRSGIGPSLLRAKQRIRELYEDSPPGIQHNSRCVQRSWFSTVFQSPGQFSQHGRFLIRARIRWIIQSQRLKAVYDSLPVKPISLVCQ